MFLFHQVPCLICLSTLASTIPIFFTLLPLEILLQCLYSQFLTIQNGDQFHLFHNCKVDYLNSNPWSLWFFTNLTNNSKAHVSSNLRESLWLSHSESIVSFLGNTAFTGDSSSPIFFLSPFFSHWEERAGT